MMYNYPTSLTPYVQFSTVKPSHADVKTRVCLLYPTFVLVEKEHFSTVHDDVYLLFADAGDVGSPLDCLGDW